MHTVKFDLMHGLVLVDLVPIATNEEGVLAQSIAKLCSPPVQIDEGRIQYRLFKKASVCGKSADGIIEVTERRVCAVTFLFDLIEFFEFSVIESKILQVCEKSLGIKFLSSHPSTAYSDPAEWGQAKFYYDPKQGDLSLDITFERGSNDPNLKG